MRFTVSSTLLFVSAIALFCAMASRFEMETLLIFLLGIQVLGVIFGIRNWRRPYVLGSSIAVVLAGIPVFGVAFYEFLTSPTYHGHLYHEDGSQVFISLCIIALLVLSVFGASVAAVGIFAFRRTQENKGAWENADGDNHRLTR